MKDVEIIGMLKAYVKASLVGVGALKGAPCQCVITENADGTHKVTMKWVDNNGVAHTDSFDVLNGQIGEFADISDVSLTNLQNGQVVAYNSTTQKWENVTNSATVNTLNSVGDVTITAVQDGEALVWDDTAGKWVNKDVSVTIDSVLSSTSENPVQNKVLYLALEDKADKATTLSGYGINDAYTKTETNNAITAEIEKLDVSDSATAGSYVTAVSEADGKISVIREAADVTPTANSKKMLTSGGAKTALDAKQDTLTFDDAPTENSDNPVKSGGVYAANEALTNKLNNEIVTRSALGAKNILPFDLADIKALNTGGTWESNVYTYRGVDFTVNSDGTISATGTATGGNASIKIFAASLNYEMLGKEVILNGCPSGGGASTYRIQAYRMASADGSTGTYFDDGTGTDAFTVLNNASGTVGSFAVAVYENETVTNLLFKPMVRLASDPDDTYQPYAKTNRELTSEQGYCTEDQYTAMQTLLS